MKPDYYFQGLCPKDVTKVIFLDLDGVILPHGYQDYIKRINDKHLLDQFYQELNETYQIDYKKFNWLDLNGFLNIRTSTSVLLIKKVLEETQAKIVLSSDWRYGVSKKYMSDLFRLIDFHKYYIDDTIYITYHDKDNFIKKLFKYPDPFLNHIKIKGKNIQNTSQVDFPNRALEIIDYLHTYPHITHFVAIDDLDLSNDLSPNFVKTINHFTQKHADQALKILSKKQNIYPGTEFK
jgi:hypothetical protein